MLIYLNNFIINFIKSNSLRHLGKLIAKIFLKKIKLFKLENYYLKNKIIYKIKIFLFLFKIIIINFFLIYNFYLIDYK